MIPLVCSDHEIECITPVIRHAAKSVRDSTEGMTDYQMGAMLEVPRALIRADSIAKIAGISFLSIGSNDLTQLMVSSIFIEQNNYDLRGSVTN